MTADSLDREKAIRETDRSFAVEASAGTGKTTTLVDRILHLVLERGPEGVPLRLLNVCAITFTEKAAGEMKIRLRQEFEKRARGTGDSAERARIALRDVETAPISTFHALAVSLLKERPVEAGLDPRFSTLDENQSELLFREVWDAWLQRALKERHEPLERALRSGISLDGLEELARTLRLHARNAQELELVSPLTDDEVREQTRIRLETAYELRSLILNSGDKLVAHLEKTIYWLENPSSNCPAPQKPGNAGAAANWSGGKDTVGRAQEFVREAADFCCFCGQLPQQRVLDAVVRWMVDGFLPEWQSQKRKRGLVDFDDQLALARDLLKRNRFVRREFQKQYAALLVDEFQDTDPLQLEIVRLLSSPDLEETDPARLRPAPGRLFVVGDPKQSIYRFRRADIESYLEIAQLEKLKDLQVERLQLSNNFRSVPSILRFVDSAFHEAMKASDSGHYQPEYASFGGHGERAEEPSPPSVYILGNRPDEGDSGTGGGFFEREAARVAKLISQIRGNELWKVADRNQDREKGTVWRVPAFGDIAVLLPVLTRCDALEEALRETAIPYVLEGGKFYYARSEVSSALTVLRALANPNDSIALYGSLRSIFFGLSDEDLLREHMAGRPLDYRREVPQDSLLHQPYLILRELHGGRHDRPPSETLETLLHRTGAREVLAVRGFQSLANLAKLVRTLRSLETDATFSQAVDLLRAMDEEGQAESESRVMEEQNDAVRVMSIHKAKGLDFPIVIVAGLGLTRRPRNSSFLSDPHRRKSFAASIRMRDSRVHTPGWTELAEEDRKRDDAELVRLLYVALTRARDRLIVCTHTRGWKKSAEGKPQLDANGSRLQPLCFFLSECYCGGSEARILDEKVLDAATVRPRAVPPGIRDWGAIARRQYDELARLLRETPSSIDAVAATGEGREVDAEPSRAARLGIAFHDAMEKADSGLDDRALVSEPGARLKLDPAAVRDLEQMLRLTRHSALFERVTRARRSGARILKELPFVRPLSGGAIEEGKIDLLFEEPEGYVLVDYKTDEYPAGADIETLFREKHGKQILQYVQALASMGVKVSSAYLLMARTGAAIQIPI